MTVTSARLALTQTPTTPATTIRMISIPNGEIQFQIDRTTSGFYVRMYVYMYTLYVVANMPALSLGRYIHTNNICTKWKQTI